MRVPEMGYRQLEHTGDTGIEAWGRDLAETFEQAACGVFALMVDIDAIVERVERAQSLRASGHEMLLVSWLNTLIGLVDTEGLVFRRCRIDHLTEHELRARAYGERLDPARHVPHVAVKAATLHGIEVHRGPPGRVRVILDL